jgi:hypothetical protein
MSRQIVKEKRNIWKYVPLAGKNRFATTTGYVTYLPPRLWKQWNTTPRTQNVLDLVRHESVHVEQWEAEGAEYVRKYYKYRAWRLRYEVAAYAEQCRYNPTVRRISRYAGWLSSWRYGFLGSKASIMRQIRDAALELNRPISISA